MTRHISQRPLILQDENLSVVSKKIAGDATTKNSRPVVKKGGNVLGSRKALNDITNKSSTYRGTSSKKNSGKEELNIAEEMCLHDHKKCIEAQQKAKKPCYPDSVLHGHDSLSHSEHLESESAKTNPESPRCYPEPLEMPTSKFSDGLVSLTHWTSPISSPSPLVSPTSSPISWNIEPNFVLKEDGTVFESLKALNDITSTSSIDHGTSSEKNIPEGEFNIAEEMCLHDHKKCIEAKQKERESCYLDFILAEHKSFSDSEHLEYESAKTDPESFRCYPEPVELPMTEFSDWLVSSTQWVSPPSSPLGSPSYSPISWNIELDFVLKGDDFGYI